MRLLAGCVLLCVSLALLAGCGSSGPKTCTVTGTVTFNGNPLPQGRILFEPEDGKGVPGAGQVKDGAYKLEVKPGKKKVQIHADREVGEPDPVMGARRRESYIPAEYNSKTTLKAEVTPGQKNEFPFELKGPEPKQGA